MVQRFTGLRGTAGLLAVLLAGLGLRAYHYLRCPPVWHDEAALILNVLAHDCSQLWGPLRFHEAAPPLFLWLERAVYLFGGDSEYVLRLPAFLAGCLALVLLVPIARRLLPPQRAFWAVLLFACSEQLLWHCCEAKPYSFDVLVAVLLLGAWVFGRQRPALLCLLLAALAPLFLWLSYPACFVYGGLLVALLPCGVPSLVLRAWRKNPSLALRAGVPRAGWGTWLSYGVLTLTVGMSFLALVLGPVSWQHDAEISQCWTNCFPNWGRPGSVPLWLFCSTAEVCRYCIKPLGQILFAFAAVGVWTFWRQGQRQLVVVLTVPVLLALIAACLHRYPFGGARVMVYAAPAVVLLIAAAVPLWLAWAVRLAGRWGAAPRRLALPGMVVFLLVPLALALLRVAWPWPVADTAGAAAYVQARCQPGDTVRGNDWTHLYYFRHAGSAFRWCEDTQGGWGSRLWLVCTCLATPEERQATAGLLAPGWRVADHQEFLHTTVLLLEPPADSPAKIPSQAVAVSRAAADNRPQ